MCVRTPAGGEDRSSSPRPGETPPTNDSATTSDAEQQRQRQEEEADTRSASYKNGLTRAKEKYMKLHEEMLERETLQTSRRRRRREIDERAGGLLAKGTRMCGRALRIARERARTWRDYKIYKILFCTTQPAHVITIAAVLCVTSALVPNSTTTSVAGQQHPSRSRLTSFVYLASFVTHFGSQIWMTFVSGLSLYFALPRHTFGEVQRVLFPRYFTLNACLSLTTLLVYVKHHPTTSWDAEIAIQVAGMGGAFFLELLIRLYLTPPLLRLIDLKTSIERAAGVGAEIGRHDPGPLKHCPHYLKIHRAFRRIHVTIAMGNMLTMACTVLHLHHVASKLCVL